MIRFPAFKFLGLLFILAFPLTLCAQGGTWVWVRGSDTTDPVVTYPIRGLADTANNPPSLYGAASWIDLDGNFWVFGGGKSFSPLSCLSDLWKYNPHINIWTWIKGPGIPAQNGIYGIQGVAADSNCPGARFNSTTWTDNNGDLWLFGGYGWGEYMMSVQAADLEDLWKYNISTNKWTWINGDKRAYNADYIETDTTIYGIYQHPSPLNTPGGRHACSSWVDDNNNLWLFGGAFNGIDLGGENPFNDLWQYNINTNEWTWIKGPQGAWEGGNYGTLGIEDPDNLPPARAYPASWSDSAGNFYLFGGGAFTPQLHYAPLYNDVWKYNPISNMWTWITGDSANDTRGYYEQYCIDTGDARPSARLGSGTCQALCRANAALTFGGCFFVTYNTDSIWTLNDLWLFDTKTNRFKWVSGNTAHSDTGSYGMRGIANLSNLPPARYAACQWIDNHGALWIFGGAHSGTNDAATFNDVWEFIPDSSCIQTPLSAGIYYSLSKNDICKGDTVLLTLTGDANARVRPNVAVTWLDSIHAMLYPDSTTIYTISGQSYCGNNDSQSVIIKVHTTINVQVTASDTVFCQGDSIVLSAPYGYSAYQWSNGDTGSYIYVQQAGSYHVSVTEKPVCSAVSDTVSVGFYSTLPVSISQNGDSLIAYGETSYQWFRNDTLIPGAHHSVYVAPSPATYTFTAIDSNGCRVTSFPLVISGIERIADDKITIYPNPTGTQLICIVPTPAIAHVISSDGKTVMQNIPLSQGQSGIDISPLAAGIYFLVVQEEDQEWVRKFVKE